MTEAGDVAAKHADPVPSTSVDGSGARPVTVGAAYLDHAAATPMRPEAVEAMLPFLTSSFGNPSGAHGASRIARRALDDSREELAALLGCDPAGVIFTSGGTEADNLAVLGTVAGRGGTVVVSAVEHRAVLSPGLAVGAQLAPVTGDGRVDLAAFEVLLEKASAFAQPVVLVSVMLVNSETGVIEPVADVRAATARLAPDALVHTDAAQAFTWLDVARLTAAHDLVSISAHKFGGPKGVGALVVRERAAPLLKAVLHGGGQERELRPGTQNVAGAVAMATAARLAHAERAATVARVAGLRDRLADGLVAAVGALEPAPRALRVAGNCHLRFPGVAAEELVLLADGEGVASSTGSACASGARDPSHVLLAMGWDRSAAREAVRLSLGATTTAAEVDHALYVLTDAVERLRGAGRSPRRWSGGGPPAVEP